VIEHSLSITLATLETVVREEKSRVQWMCEEIYQIKSNHFISGIVAHSEQTDRYT